MKCGSSSSSLSVVWWVGWFVRSALVLPGNVAVAKAMSFVEMRCTRMVGLDYAHIGSIEHTDRKDFQKSWNFRIGVGAKVQVGAYQRNATDSYETKYGYGQAAEVWTLESGYLSATYPPVKSAEGVYGYGVYLKANWETKLADAATEKVMLPGVSEALQAIATDSAKWEDATRNKQINGYDVFVVDFDGYLQHDMTFTLSHLDDGEEAMYRTYRKGVKQAEGAISGRSQNDFDVAKVISLLGYDAIEFYVGNDDIALGTSYLVHMIEYCLPITCDATSMNVAYQHGDTHLESFDALKWDCQGEGIFQSFLGKKQDQTEFSIQTLLTRKVSSDFVTTPPLPITWTRAVSIDSGDADQPTIMLSIDPTKQQCELQILADQDPITEFTTQYPFNTNAIVMHVKNPDTHGNHRYKTIELSFLLTHTEVTIVLVDSVQGCHLNIAVCLGSNYWDQHEEGLTTSATGMMGGKRDDTQANDWIKRDGTIVAHAPSDLRSSAAYDFCTDWCIDNENDTHFVNVPFSYWNKCAIPYDDTVEQKVRELSESEDDIGKMLCTIFTQNTVADLDECYTEYVVGNTTGVTTYIVSKTELQNTTLPEGVIAEEDVYQPAGARDVPSGVTGDPHFTTWAGHRYDYHGICDLILLRNQAFHRGLGIEIHIRSKRTLKWSYISTAVVRIGSELVEIAGKKDGDAAWINMVEVTNEEWKNNNVRIAGYQIRLEEFEDPKQREYTINLGNMEGIIIKTFKNMVRVNVVNPTEKHFAGSVGLMGSYPDGNLVGRDGKTEFKELQDFGQQWQVLSNEPKIFRLKNDGPQHPMMCESPSKEAMRRGLAESTISRAAAESACLSVRKEEFDLCVFDVMATGDMESVGAY